MKARIQKWGNSMALRIPKSFAAEARLEQDTLVEMTPDGGNLVVSVAQQPEATLAQLLDQVTEQNLHRELDTGPAVGNEA